VAAYEVGWRLDAGALHELTCLWASPASATVTCQEGADADALTALRTTVVGGGGDSAGPTITLPAQAAQLGLELTG
jgi:hypothetical protein